MTSASLSKRPNSSFRVFTSSWAERINEREVKPMISANKMLREKMKKRGRGKPFHWEIWLKRSCCGKKGQLKKWENAQTHQVFLGHLINIENAGTGILQCLVCLFFLNVNLFVCLPDVFVVVDVDLVELLRQQVLVHRSHVADHFHHQEARQDGHHQALL